jgi:protoporphyrinogen IX oxidase
VLWLKAFHVVFVVTWFAGLFYLPRLFVYHAAANDAIGRERFEVMERRLFVIMSIGAGLAAVFGALLVLARPDYLSLPWMQVKLVMVGLLLAYHLWCVRLVSELQAGRARTQRWYRWFNEVPGLLLIAIVVLAVVEPSFR